MTSRRWPLLLLALVAFVALAPAPLTIGRHEPVPALAAADHEAAAPTCLRQVACAGAFAGAALLTVLVLAAAAPLAAPAARPGRVTGPPTPTAGRQPEGGIFRPPRTRR